MIGPTPPAASGSHSLAPRLRRGSELAGQLAALRRWTGAGPTAEFYRGAADALAWLIAGGAGPLSGRGYARPVTIVAVTTELAHADELTATGHRARRRDYVIGVEHALQWAGHDTTVAPLPTGTRDRERRAADRAVDASAVRADHDVTVSDLPVTRQQNTD